MSATVRSTATEYPGTDCPSLAGTRNLRHELPINNRRSMLASSNSDLVPRNCVPGCLLGKPIFVGGTRQLWLLNERMPLFFGVKYGHMKLWIPLFDFKRRLLGRFVRFVSRLQLPIDCNMKWFGEGRFAEFSDRGCCRYWQSASLSALFGLRISSVCAWPFL